VIGLGLFQDVDDNTLDGLIASVQSTKTRAQIQMVPGTAALIRRLTARGLERGPSWIVHARQLDTEPPEIATPDYRIERVTTANAAAWSDTLLAAWDFPAWAATGVLAVTLPLVQNPAFICLAAIHTPSSQIAAGGMLYVNHGIAGLYADCVRPKHRHHQLHDALIAARLREARQLGCDLACCQTLANHPAERNVAQAGFQTLYTQHNIFTPRVRG
jgi:GNAT superfamily N-acetyltransferase